MYRPIIVLSGFTILFWLELNGNRAHFTNAAANNLREMKKIFCFIFNFISSSIINTERCDTGGSVADSATDNAQNLFIVTCDADGT